MTKNSEQLMSKIEARVSVILGTKTPKEDLDNMCRLQREHTPHLTRNEAEEYVIQGLIETYRDHELDHLWYQFKNISEEKSVEAA